ncbi:MAG TPA: Type 1 glutamine amidotransferase-like domain-containing protein [Candidatus Limnocylindria bacterium]|nr:Type 1 glutamine amidotransferase-like domain-containing protein [Candidatus Limnocylindria bacterium]
MTTAPGPLILVGGAEFLPGNEPHDEIVAEAAADGAVLVIATAAVRQDPDAAVRTAKRWFTRLGVDAKELPMRGRRQAAEAETVAAARAGRAFYLCGGDPGLVVKLLAGTPGWDALVESWRRGAPLAGSSAGAMALGDWTLIRSGLSHARRRFADALGLVPRAAVVPHFEEFGEGWLPSVRRVGRNVTLIGLDTRTAAVWRPSMGWQAMGRGRALVVEGDRRSEFGAGEKILRLPSPRWRSASGT